MSEVMKIYWAFWFIVVFSILGFMAYTQYQWTYSPDIPQDISVIETWDERKVYKLMENTLECPMFPDSYLEDANDPQQTKYLETCIFVKKVWIKKYHLKKKQEILEKSKNIS